MEQTYLRVKRGDFPIILVIIGAALIVIGGAMGGNVTLYTVFLIAVPIISYFIMRKGNVYSLYTAAILYVYTCILYYLAFPITALSLVFYAVMIYAIFQLYLARKLFGSKGLIGK